MVDKTFKIMICGPRSAGKTTFCESFSAYPLFKETELTIGVNFFVKILKINELEIKLQIWVFNGEDRFKFLLPTYIKAKDGVFIIFDLNNQEQFNEIEDYLLLIQEFTAAEIPYIILGNKIDLMKDEFREMHRNKVQSIINIKDSHYFEISAKEGINVENALKLLINKMLEKHGKISITAIELEKIKEEIKENTQDKVIIIMDLLKQVNNLKFEGDFDKAKVMIQNVRNLSVKSGLKKFINLSDELFKELNDEIIKTQEKLISNKKKIHHSIFKKKLNRCPLFIDSTCSKVEEINELINSPKIFGFFMYQFPKENEYDYILEIKKISELIKNLNEDPLLEIKFPYESTSLDIKTCDFCKFSRSFDFGILLMSPKNVNAFFEAGMFLSLGKKVILLNNSSREPNPPFDLDPFFVIWYNNLEKLEKEWNRKLPKCIHDIKEYYLTV